MNHVKFYMATDIEKRTTFILEIWRRGSRTLHCSSMPASIPVGDTRIRLTEVPLYIRRAARVALITESTH